MDHLDTDLEAGTGHVVEGLRSLLAGVGEEDIDLVVEGHRSRRVEGEEYCCSSVMEGRASVFVAEVEALRNTVVGVGLLRRRRRRSSQSST